MSWESALSLWSLLEGPTALVTHPNEGDTAGGVLRRYYIVWAQQKGRDPVWPPTEEAHGSYLHDEIWTPHMCFFFPDPCDAVVFQCVGNLPWDEGNQVLQRALGVVDDGRIGPQTLGAIRLYSADSLAERILDQQAIHYQSVNGPELRGLLNRVTRVRDWLANAG